MQKTNLKVSKQKNSGCDSDIIEGELSHLVFDVENPAAVQRQQRPHDECGDGGGGTERHFLTQPRPKLTRTACS